jgi:hypothetical protein
MRGAVVVIGLLAILAGLFLAKRADQPSLGTHNQDCIDPASPPLNRATTLLSLCIEGDWFLSCHAEEVRL